MSNVSHHFRLLGELGRIELARTRPVRGSIEHIYTRAEAPEIEGFELTSAGLSQLSGANADLIELVSSIIGRCRG